MNSMVIWKSALSLTDTQEIMVPTGAVMLGAREQFGHVCVWYCCNPSAPLSPRKIEIVGTGHQMFGWGGKYLGSAMLEGGALVLHVFEYFD